MCLILLFVVSSSVYFSYFTLTHYTYPIPSTNSILNIYIEQKYTLYPLELNLTFKNTIVIFYVYNKSQMSISYFSPYLTPSNQPIIFYNNSLGATIIQINYIIASNITIKLNTTSQFIYIIGNTSYMNISISSFSNETSTVTKIYGFSSESLAFIFVSIIVIILFIILRKYKGH